MTERKFELVNLLRLRHFNTSYVTSIFAVRIELAQTAQQLTTITPDSAPNISRETPFIRQLRICFRSHYSSSYGSSE